MFAGLQNPRSLAAQLMNFGLVLSTAFMVRCCYTPSRTL
jgi:signal peptidase